MRLLYPLRGENQKSLVYVTGSLWETAQQLVSKKIIGNALSFYLLGRYKKVAIVSGEYQLEGNMSYSAILAKLHSGKVMRYRLTFPEGFTLKQIAARLARHGIVPEELFLKEAASPSFSIASFPHVPQKGSLEGFLFPETYFFQKNSSIKNVLVPFLAQFERMLPENIDTITRHKGLSIKQIITVASLIEKEAVKDRERPIIAGVIYNRLKRNMRLEIDATVQYALGTHQSRILLRHLQIDSPYNTYKIKGLPPGPICNPGLESIYAALSPAHHPYLYYVARKDGSHYFSQTFAEHKKRKLQARRES